MEVFTKSIKVHFINSVRRCLKLNYIFFMTSDDLSFRIDRPQRMIILENLNWLYAAPEKSWTTLKLFQYLHWVKETLGTRLFQVSVDLATDWRPFCWLQTFSAICKWTLFICTRYYFISQLSCCWERICLERKEQPHGYAIQELVFTP